MSQQSGRRGVSVVRTVSDSGKVQVLGRHFRLCLLVMHQVWNPAVFLGSLIMHRVRTVCMWAANGGTHMSLSISKENKTTRV